MVNSFNYILLSNNKMNITTDMKLIFHALNGNQNKYNWLISDIDINPLKDLSVSAQVFFDKYIFISGEELTKIFDENNIQFIWGVFSAFEKDIEIDIENLEVEPYAEGNPNFWITNPKIQHPKAVMEIVCWDSTYTLFLTKNEESALIFSDYFEDVKNLNKYNEINEIETRSKWGGYYINRENITKRNTVIMFIVLVLLILVHYIKSSIH